MTLSGLLVLMSVLGVEMHPHLKKDWRYILKYAWSARLLMVAVLLTGAEVFLQFFPWFDWLTEMQYALLMLSVTTSSTRRPSPGP